MHCVCLLCLLTFGIALHSVQVAATGNGDIRLRGGYYSSGRVEIYYNGVWGTICDDSWDLADANVVCRQLGFGPAEVANRNAFYGFFGTTTSYWVAGSVRLLGGSAPNEGRVEVYWDGEWNTVCDDYWDLNDANVVCRQLGYSSAINAVTGAYFGHGSGDILLDNVNCNGYERNLMQCDNNGIYMHDCDHLEDAGVVCATELDNSTPSSPYVTLRLAGSNSPHEGRVEIYYENTWGTICDDFWEYNDALVVCRQLGFSAVARFNSDAQFGEGSGPILRGIDCSGNEYFWEDCNFNDWDTTFCSHSEDAAVTCTDTDFFPTTSYYWIDGAVRLRGGSSPREGRVEVYWDGEWNTVCDDSWDLNDAIVVCRQLGFPAAVDAVKKAFFGEGWGDILLDDVNCHGYETNLMDCQSNTLYQHDCGHSEDAGVICTNTDFFPTTSYFWIDGDIRLRGGSSPREGRVEVYWDGKWNTVCDDSWDLNDAIVVCRELGFPAAVDAVGNAFFGEGWGDILLDDVNCHGYETNLMDCQSNTLYQHDCGHSEDAGVICTNSGFSSTPFPTTLYGLIDGSVRLRGGSSPSQGRVEVYWDGEWNTVCDDSWDLNDAVVVCRQLGYPAAVNAVGDAYFGEGTGHILLDDVYCNGYEMSLVECQSSDFYDHNCRHSEDAGVFCAGSDTAPEGYFQEGSVRLKGSSLQNQGRVEIYHYGSWGTVCDDEWDLTDADVVCKQLGFPRGAYEALDLAYFGEGEIPILLDDVSCDGSEHYLADCNHNGWYNHNCRHSEDAGVQCYIPEHLYPRLVNGTTWGEGRVDVWNSDHWEGVCALRFYENEASAVCQQLGFHDVETVYSWEKFGINFAVPSSYYFVCDSDDEALSSCDQYQISSTFCDATAIKCQDNRLSGGAIAGISFAVFTFFIMFVASCIIVYRQTSRKNRRSSPTVAVISGSENFAGSQSIPYQLLDNTIASNVYGCPPPSYNDAVSDSVYYPPVNISSSITSRPRGQALTTQSNFIATRNYPIQPNPTVLNSNPSTLVYPPPTTPTVNAEESRHCPEQTYALTRQQINDLPHLQQPNALYFRNAVEDNTSSAPDDTPQLIVTNEGHADVDTNKVQSEC